MTNIFIRRGRAVPPRFPPLRRTRATVCGAAIVGGPPSRDGHPQRLICSASASSNSALALNLFAASITRARASSTVTKREQDGTTCGASPLRSYSRSASASHLDVVLRAFGKRQKRDEAYAERGEEKRDEHDGARDALGPPADEQNEAACECSDDAARSQIVCH